MPPGCFPAVRSLPEKYDKGFAARRVLAACLLLATAPLLLSCLHGVPRCVCVQGGDHRVRGLRPRRVNSGNINPFEARP